MKKPSTCYVRNPEVSVCLEGDNGILYNPDTGAEKVINASGLEMWRAMDGATDLEGMAKALALRFELPVSAAIREDAEEFAVELLRDGFAGERDAALSPPLAEEPYSRIEDAPRTMDLSLTGRCNLGCRYCFYADEMVGRSDLPVERWLTFFDELKGLAVRNVTLSGGEVFMRRDLWELIDALIDARMRYGILTNGTLITEDTIEAFAQGKRRQRLDSIQVSIDGSCAAVHDASRGAGSFVKALRGLKLLKEAAFPLTVRVTVNRHNVDDLDAIARLLLEEMGLPGFSCNDAIALGSACAQEDSVMLTPAQRPVAMRSLTRLAEAYQGRVTASAGPLALWRMFQEMEHAKATGELPQRWKMGNLSSCGCMFLKLAVHHDGGIVPCNMLSSAALGMIGETPVRSIWRDHPMLKAMRERRSIPMDTLPHCAGCEWIPYCNGGCPATVYNETGDLSRANPDICYRRFIEETGYRMGGDELVLANSTNHE